MSARSKSASNRNRGGRPKLVEKTAVENSSEKEPITTLSEKDFYNISGIKPLLWVGILLLWIWGFSYAPEYMVLHAEWEMDVCGFMGLLCLTGIVAIAAVAFDEHMKKAGELESSIVGWVTFGIVDLGLYGLINTLRLINSKASQLPTLLFEAGFFLLFLFSTSVILYYVPFTFYLCVHRTKSIKKIFTIKNVSAFILAILTALTAIFQFLQVILPMFTAHH